MRFANSNGAVIYGKKFKLFIRFKPTIGKPLLLYIDRQYAPNQIQLYNGTDLENISFYNRPSQVYVNPSSVVTSSSSSLNFGTEIDEFFRLQIGTDLFTKYYLDYILNKIQSFLKCTHDHSIF